VKRSVRTLVFVALVLCAAPTLADAPLGQYAFFDKDDTTIKDTKTLLEWDRMSLRETKTFAVASSTCPAGFRLPTVKELLTLVDEQPHQDYEFGKTITRMIDQNAFGRHTGVDAPYWSSTPSGSASTRWTVSFADGTMTALTESGQAYARCVK
jgi:hypothetical protein